MQEISTIMIHNFIFFSNAKLEYAISTNKTTAQEVLKDATRELLKSSINVLKLNDESSKIKDNKTQTNNFTAQNNSNTKQNIPPIIIGAASIYTIAVVDDFIKKITVKGGIWDRAVDWAFSYANNKNDKIKFLETVDLIIMKLDKYHHIIGKSNLMSDIIDRYSLNIINIKTEATKDKVKIKSIIYKVILFMVTGFSAFCILVSKACNKSQNTPSYFFPDKPVVPLEDYTNNWIYLGIFFISFYLLIIFPKLRLKYAISKMKKNHQRISMKFLEI